MAYQTDEYEIQKIGQFRKFLGLRVSALVEILLFFIVMIAIDWFFGAHQSFFNVCPHPYWIIVILISVQYGTAEGLVAAIVATIVLLLGHHPERTILQDQFEYFFFLTKNPMMWIVAAVILGELRLRQIRERDALKAVALTAAQKEKTIGNAYEGLKKHKERLEVRLASDLNTSLSAYQTFKKLEHMGKGEIIAGALEMVRLLVSPEKYSVYLLEGDKLKLISCTGWEEGDKFEKTLDANQPLFQQIVGSRRVVSVLNESDRQMLLNEGALAAPIVSPETKDVYGMIKIEQIPFLRLRMSTIESVRLIGEWVGTAYANYVAKEDSDSNRYISKKSELFSSKFLQQQQDFLSNLGKRLQIDISMLTVSLVNADSFTEERKIEIFRIFRQVVQESLRSIDQAFEYGTAGVECAILLINTSVENAEIVQQKIAANLEKHLDKQADFTYRITALYAR